MLAPKRSVKQLSHGRWGPIPQKSSAVAAAINLEQRRTIRSSAPRDAEEIEFAGNDRDFILSILRAKPSLRDTKSYLASFAKKPQAFPNATPTVQNNDSSKTAQTQHAATTMASTQHPLISQLLDPVHRRTALVKLQGPFTDRQLDSVARGMEYLGKLGLLSVIVVETDDWEPGAPNERTEAVEQAMRVVAALEAQGANARPVLDTIVHLGPKPEDEAEADGWLPEAHAFPHDLTPIRSALRAGEIPVLPALGLDSFCRSVRVSANDVIAALTRAMVETGQSSSTSTTDIDMTPMRLMIINREGGIPSYARAGLPHLLVNMSAEYDQIFETFLPQWNSSHPTALSNLNLARKCLSYMPRTSSAIMVSHRSPSSLIANLITNKPAQSSSLPHALLNGTKRLSSHTPTLFRHGLPIRVYQSAADIDKPKLTGLLEQSFGRKLDADAFYARVDSNLDFVIVAGDYAGAAIVTKEPVSSTSASSPSETISYLDKFAVHPSHQGDGTVDFLWVALHDESYGLGSSYARNFNVGGRQGLGSGRDLVWRSRANNPVNKWYFERSSGHLRMGDWVLFWCDAEDRLKRYNDQARADQDADVVPKKGVQAPSFVMQEERARVKIWSEAIGRIPSSWKAT